jgi:Arc-like DNA binding dprotein
MARKSQELRPVMTRIPEQLRRQLERAAAQNRRSMNSEIIDRLGRSFEDRENLIAAIATRAATAAVERLQTASFEPRQAEPKPEPSGSADTDQKDKAP